MIVLIVWFLCALIVHVDEEIFDTIADTVENSTFLKQDVVFAQLNFCLQKSIFKLMKSEGSSEGCNCKLYVLLHTVIEISSLNVAS